MFKAIQGLFYNSVQIKLTLYIIFFVLMVTSSSCDIKEKVKNSKENDNEIIIKDFYQTMNGDKHYIVYTSDTNSLNLMRYADSLVKYSGIESGVGFVFDSTRIPHFEDFGNIVPHEFDLDASYLISQDFRSLENGIDTIWFHLWVNGDKKRKIIDPNNKYIASSKIDSVLEFYSIRNKLRKEAQSNSDHFLVKLIDREIESSRFEKYLDSNEFQYLYKEIEKYSPKDIKREHSYSGEKSKYYQLKYTLVNDSMDTFELRMDYVFTYDNFKLENVKY